MDLSTITVADFKSLFSRDFPYLPVWQASPTFYNTGAIVYYATNQLFYKAKSNGVTSVPTTTADWDLYADDVNNYVSDTDIQRAFMEAEIVFNQALFGTDAQIKLGYLYVTAHYLVNDLRTALSGVGSTGEFAVESRSVGNVSESYSIPQAYLDSPIYAFYGKSGYGMKYLSMILPKLVGNVVGVCGATHP